MAIPFSIKEEKISPEFLVWTSNKVNNYLDKVTKYNKDNPSAIKELYESIDLVQEHLSYRSMGLGYAIPNPFRELGLLTYYKLQFDFYNQPYISSYRIEIEFKYFGLKDPSDIQSASDASQIIPITESDIRNAVRLVLKEITEKKDYTTRRLGKYIVVNGEMFPWIYKGLENFGEIRMCRLYDNHGDAICFFELSPSKYIATKMICDKEHKVLYHKPIKKNELPDIVFRDFVKSQQASS